MTTHNRDGDNREQAPLYRWFLRIKSLIPCALVLFAVAFNVYHLYPEVAGGGIARNDNVFHLSAINTAVEAITQRQDFTDPWQRTMGMGFPLFHHYQHLPQLILALVHLSLIHI